MSVDCLKSKDGDHKWSLKCTKKCPESVYKTERNEISLIFHFAEKKKEEDKKCSCRLAVAKHIKQEAEPGEMSRQRRAAQGPAALETSLKGVRTALIPKRYSLKRQKCHHALSLGRAAAT